MYDEMMPLKRQGMSLLRLSRTLRCEPDFVMELVRHGVLRPRGDRPVHWRFEPDQLQRAEMVRYLQRRFSLELTAIAYVVELLDMNRALRDELALVRGRRAGRSVA